MVSWIFILVSVEALTVPWLHLNEIMKMERDYLRIIHHKRRKWKLWSKKRNYFSNVSKRFSSSRKKYFVRSMFLRWRDFTLGRRLRREQELALQEVGCFRHGDVMLWSFCYLVCRSCSRRKKRTSTLRRSQRRSFMRRKRADEGRLLKGSLLKIVSIIYIIHMI